ncbi:hypothetical protein BGZ58_001839 [Dissophora ornata]|nr:hypothetical protein BGZ58_001839 [Dissophora ornata]
MTFGLEQTDATNNAVQVHGVDNIKPFLDMFSARGHNELDTARVYGDGDTEIVLGQFNVEKYKIATKVWPIVPKAHGAEFLKKTFKDSLEALKLQKVDIFYLHAPDYSTPFEETVKAVDDLYREGLFERAGGLLSGRHNFDKDVDGGRFNEKNAFGKIYRERYWNTLYFDAIKMIEKVTKEHNITLIESALRWMTHHSGLGPNDAIIAGASSLKHLEDNLNDLEKGPLPKEVLDVYDEAWENVKVACPSYFKSPVVSANFATFTRTDSK